MPLSRSTTSSQASDIASDTRGPAQIMNCARLRSCSRLDVGGDVAPVDHYPADGARVGRGLAVGVRRLLGYALGLARRSAQQPLALVDD
ncbi:hypothetical protein [Pseudomonas saudiphocaensis]|uniref:hypothetical protein n=1 Tax=Pseudomonas saudiphocaensis TaxID=1499686 RepID=UPI001494F81E|nr:hypothetical protein [Pseudomonas saudiphocaensis]